MTDYLQVALTSFRSGWRSADITKLLINVFVLIVICAVASSKSNVFMSWANWENIGERIAYIVIISVPFTLLLISGAFDLSVGSTMALAGVSAALLSRDMPIELALALGSMAGLIVGALNSILVVGLKIHSFIATIGMLYVARGSALLLSGGAEVSSVPYDFADFGNLTFYGVSIQIPIALGLVVLFVIIQNATTLGTYTVASGSNENAAFLAGVPVQRTRAICFLLTGSAAGFAGALQASQFGIGSPTASEGLEFEVILAVVVGGTSLFGGSGKVLGTLLGALVIGVVFNTMNLTAVPSYWQKVALGTILFAAVGIDRLVFYYPQLKHAIAVLLPARAVDSPSQQQAERVAKFRPNSLSQGSNNHLK